MWVLLASASPRCTLLREIESQYDELEV